MYGANYYGNPYYGQSYPPLGDTFFHSVIVATNIVVTLNELQDIFNAITKGLAGFIRTTKGVSEFLTTTVSVTVNFQTTTKRVSE